MTILQNKSLMVVGTFRSGTNAMLDTLERNYYCNPTFNKYFWKHCIPPHSEMSLFPPDLGVVCMVRNPLEWNRSLFKFWHTRRKELIPPLQISKFIREPLIVYDNSKGLSDIRYHFNSPIDYWNKYYYAWTFWENIRNQLVFVKLEDFELQTESVLNILERKFSLERKPNWIPVLPEERIGPFVPKFIDSLITEFSDSDKEFINYNCLSDLKVFFNY